MFTDPLEIQLVVHGIDLDDEPTLAILSQRFDDILWAESAGTATATVLSETDPVADALAAAQRIQAALPHVLVTRVKPDLVTTSAIAARVGVKRQAVYQWVTGSASTRFPAPFAVLEPEGKPVKVWRWLDVVPWLQEVKSLAFEPLPTSSQVAAINAALAASVRPTRWTPAPFVPATVLAVAAQQPRVRVVTERVA